MLQSTRIFLASIALLGLLVTVETIPDIFRTVVGNVAMDVAATRVIAGEGDADERGGADAIVGAGA